MGSSLAYGLLNKTAASVKIKASGGAANRSYFISAPDEVRKKRAVMAKLSEKFELHKKTNNCCREIPSPERIRNLMHRAAKITKTRNESMSKKDFRSYIYGGRS